MICSLVNLGGCSVPGAGTSKVLSTSTLRGNRNEEGDCCVSFSFLFFMFEEKMKLEDDSSINVSIFIFLSACLLQHVRWTRAGEHSCISDCISPHLLFPDFVGPKPSSSFLLDLYPLTAPGDGYHSHSPFSLALAKLNNFLPLMWWSWQLVFRKGHPHLLSWW